jgi:hypothetical protein
VSKNITLNYLTKHFPDSLSRVGYQNKKDNILFLNNEFSPLVFFIGEDAYPNVCRLTTSNGIVDSLNMSSQISADVMEFIPFIQNEICGRQVDNIILLNNNDDTLYNNLLLVESVLANYTSIVKRIVFHDSKPYLDLLASDVETVNSMLSDLYYCCKEIFIFSNVNQPSGIVSLPQFVGAVSDKCSVSVGHSVIMMDGTVTDNINQLDKQKAGFISGIVQKFSRKPNVVTISSLDKSESELEHNVSPVYIQSNVVSDTTPVPSSVESVVFISDEESEETEEVFINGGFKSSNSFIDVISSKPLSVDTDESWGNDITYEFLYHKLFCGLSAPDLRERSKFISDLLYASSVILLLKNFQSDLSMLGGFDTFLDIDKYYFDSSLSLSQDMSIASGRLVDCRYSKQSSSISVVCVGESSNLTDTLLVINVTNLAELYSQFLNKLLCNEMITFDIFRSEVTLALNNWYQRYSDYCDVNYTFKTLEEMNITIPLNTGTILYLVWDNNLRGVKASAIFSKSLDGFELSMYSDLQVVAQTVNVLYTYYTLCLIKL